MFSLITTIVSIALIVATLIVGGYYGGGAITDALAKTEATRLTSEEVQIFAAMDMFRAGQMRWPVSIEELVSTDHLRSIPQGVGDSGSASLGWSMPLASHPIIYTSTSVSERTCRAYNLASRGDDGILLHPFETLRAQCYGTPGAYQVVVRKPCVALADALLVFVEGGNLPSKELSDWWAVLPSGPIKSPIDPEKIPRSAADLSALSFSATTVGDVSSATATLTNIGVDSLTVTAPGAASVSGADFSYASSTCGATLAPSDTCAITVNFAPTSSAERSGWLSIETSAGTSTVALTATALAAFAQLELPQGGAEDFGYVLHQQSAISATRTVLNSGNIAVKALALSAPTGVDLVANTCGNTLDAGASCSFALRFSPAAYQTTSGRVEVTSSNGGSAGFDVLGKGTTLFSDGGGTLLGSAPREGMLQGSTPSAVDTGKQYKVRARLRLLSGNMVVFVGVVPYDQNGASIVNRYGGYPYAASAGRQLTSAMGWQVFEGVISGSYTPAIDVYDPSQFFTGTKAATPLILYNYYGAPGVVEVDYLELVDVATGAVLNSNSDMSSGISGWTDV